MDVLASTFPHLQATVVSLSGLLLSQAGNAGFGLDLMVDRFLQKTVMPLRVTGRQKTAFTMQRLALALVHVAFSTRSVT